VWPWNNQKSVLFLEKNNLLGDIIIMIISSLVIFAMFHVFDGFEAIYNFTREYEDWELDEYVLFFLAIPLPVSWLAFRQAKRANREAAKSVDLEKNLAHSRKLEALGTLAGGVAHEINNQLLPVMTMAEMIHDSLTNTDPNYRKIELIIAGANNAKRTVAKILEFSRIGMNSTKACEVSTVCQSNIEFLKTICPANVRIAFDSKTYVGNVAMTEDDLQGILVNLFSNAVDAIDENQGEVSISIDLKEIDEKTVSLNLPTGKYAEITIRDTGMGIPDEVFERIFEPFFTTKTVGKGVGLGMSIVHTAITQAGGDIQVTSKQGDGSTFIIYLPLIEDEGAGKNDNLRI